MSSKAICIRETLYSAIRSVSAVSWLFARSPGGDFTRNVKLPFAKLITLILSLKGSRIICELMEHFACTTTLVSEPAFVKRRLRCDMVDRSNAAYPAIIIADRGYESYNVLAHIQEKVLKFLIRVKDRSSSGIANGLELPIQDEFDVPIRLTLSRKQTNKFKGLLDSKNEFKQPRNYTFDYLPIKKGLTFRLTSFCFA